MSARYGGQANKKANQNLYQPIQKLIPSASERQEPHLHTRESSTCCALRSMSFATLPDAGLLFLGSCLGSWRGSSGGVIRELSYGLWRGKELQGIHYVKHRLLPRQNFTTARLLAAPVKRQCLLHTQLSGCQFQREA